MTRPPTPVRRTRSPRGSGAALGQEVVAAALEVVDEAGAPALTLRGLARTVGVSAPAIYRHFADLDAVLLAVAQRLFADLAEHLVRAREAAPTSESRLRAMARGYLAYAVDHPGRYLLMFGSQWDAASAVDRGTVGRGVVDELGQDVLALFVEVLGDGSPTTHEGRALTDATTVWVLLHGYAHQRLVSRAFPWPEDMTEHVLDSVGRAAGVDGTTENS